MQRHEWEFEYTASKIAQAAEAQRDFRILRILVWEAKKEEIMAKVHASGLTISESVADQLMSNSYKIGTRSGRVAQIMIDPTMQDDLTECVQKIREHTDLRNAYEAWAQVLLAHPEKRVKLDHEDWIYFFGK